MASYTISVPTEYGYVVLTAVSSVAMLMFQTYKVVMARKKYNVPYPIMYSDDSEKEGKIFNCTQRAHQNTLENYTPIMMCMLLGGVQHPLVAAGGGMVWISGRIAYTIGYATGEPEKRQRGAFGYAGTFAIYGTAISFGLHLLGVLGK